MKILDHETYTVFPDMCFEKISKALDEKGIDYEVVNMGNAPEDVPEHCVFKGREIYKRISCLKTKIDPKEMTAFIDSLY